MSRNGIASICKFLFFFMILGVLVFPGFANTNPYPLQITDARGIDISIPKQPSRIVSLSPSLTEILFAVGAGDRVKGVTSYCNYPEEATMREQVGGFSEKTISIEKIVSLKPDLVFVDNSRHGSITENLERYGIPVVSTNASSIEDIFALINLIGRSTGNSEKSKAILDDMRRRIESVSKAVADIALEKRPQVFWETWDDPLMTAGPTTFISQLITLAGGRNIFSDVQESWPTVSHEELLHRNPDVLMSSDTHEDKFTIEQMRSRTGWSELNAVKDNRVYLLDGDMVSRPGPRIVTALETIAVSLYPSRF